VTVYLAWTSERIGDAPGPWEEWREIGPGLFLMESTESLSAVYHAVKWLLPGDAALLVSPVEIRPKSRGLRAGTTAWLRNRLPRPS
jgi:hypothetical protein